LTDIGTLAGGINSYSNALAVSNDGVVVGWSTSAAGSLHAFRWTRAQGMVDIGAIGGVECSSYAAAGAMPARSSVRAPRPRSFPKPEVTRSPGVGHAACSISGPSATTTAGPAR